jgi:predicted kinase
MSKIYLCQGLPASGKSTWAKEKVAEDGNCFRLNKDDIRAMMFGNSKWSPKKEGIVEEVEFKSAASILTADYGLVVDDTNLNSKIVRKWENLANAHKAKLELVSFLDTPLATCIARDKTRDKKVGRAVIENMALRNGLINWDKYEEWAIYDVDGTLLDIEHRRHFVQGANKDWKAFFAGCCDDTPRQEVVDMFHADKALGRGIVVVSGRPLDMCGFATYESLEKAGLEYDHIFMRNGGDFRSDVDVKNGFLKFMPQDKIKHVVDDRPSVLKGVWLKAFANNSNVVVTDVGDGIDF